MGLAHGQVARRAFAQGRSRGLMFGLVFASCIVAILMGLIAYTADPIFVALAATLVIAPVLIVRPSWSIWVLLLGGMLVAGVLPIWAEGQASKAVWSLSALSFLLMMVVLLRALMTPGLTKGTPAFVWAALVFMVYALLDGLFQWSTPYEVLSGAKRYFQAFGLLFALCWLPLRGADIQRWRNFFVVVALTQLPWAVYERIRLVPIRENLQALYRLVPIDVVSGTFGANMHEGGANAEMATFLIIVLAFMLARFRENLISGGRMLLLVPLVIAPLFLGETKVVVILLPVMFIVLYRRELVRRPHVALLGLIVGVLLTTAAAFAYVKIAKHDSLESLIAETVRYNFQEKGHGDYLLNRTTTLRFWAQKQSLTDPVSPVFGNGLGSAHDATGGHIARKYAGYGVGLTAAPTLLWDLGVVGLTLFLAILGLAWRAAGKLARDSRAADVRADASAIQAAIPLFVIYLVYRIALLEGLSFQIVFACVLGYLAWLQRRASAA